MQDRTQYLIDEVCKLAGYITERDSKIDAQAKRIAALEEVVEAARVMVKAHDNLHREGHEGAQIRLTDAVNKAEHALAALLK